MTTKTLDIDVGGMTCAACVGRVERGLKKVAGVQDASVNLATERASVQYLPAATSPAKLREAVQNAGYEVPDEAAQTQSRLDAERERKEHEIAGQRRALTAAATSPDWRASESPARG